MNDDLKKIFGDEFPAAITILGQRMTVVREDAYTRHYSTEDGTHRSQVSRFEDGSATISLSELRSKWHGWSQRERLDFATSCNGLRRNPEFPDMLRYVAAEGDAQVWSSIALQISMFLPRDEAFDVLVSILGRLRDHTANVTQAIAATRHRNARSVLSAHLVSLWGRPDLWEDDPFTNWSAFDAICCIDNLIQLGVEPKDLEEKARQLSVHRCAGTRESCSTFLSPHYEWLEKPDLGRLGL